MSLATEYEISTGRERLDLDWIHHRLSTDTYWAPNRPRARVVQSLENSYCYGVYSVNDDRQVGFARLITDFTSFAWLCDVYIDRSLRGIGLSKYLLEHVMSEVQQWQLRRIVLATADAQDLYSRYGFVDVMQNSSTWMHVAWPDNP